MIAAHAAQLEVAECDAREPWLGGQRTTTKDEIDHERDAKHVVVGAEKQVQQQQLDEQVQQVDRLQPTAKLLLLLLLLLFLTLGTYWSRGSLKIKIDTKDRYDHSVSAVIIIIINKVMI